MQIPYTIPESLDDVTLGQYQAFVALPDGGEEFLKRKLLQIFCGIPERYIDQLKRTEVEEALRHVDFVVSQAINKSTPAFVAPQKVTIDGVDYGLHPDLNSMTIGEFADLDTYIATPSTYHKAMAVLYRPITNSNSNGYLIEPYKGTAHSEAMRKLPMSAKLGVDAFFLTIGQDLMNSIQKSLNHQIQENLPTNDLPKNGDGTQAYSRALMEKLQSWKQLLLLTTIRPCTIWLTMRTTGV